LSIRRAKITAVSHYLPERRVTNKDLEKIVDTSDEWIVERTGIRERHVAAKGQATSDLAAAATKRLLEQYRVDPAEIDLIIVATVTPDMFFPSTACLVQTKIGAKRAWGFDLSGACSGFVYALATATQFIASGVHKKVLVIGADVMTSIIDFKDRATCVLFGDGAGAVLVEPAEDGERGIIDFILRSDGGGGQFLYMPAGGSLNPASTETIEKKMHYVHQEGSQVFKYAVRRMADLAAHLVERNGLKSEDIAIVVPHQANLRIIKAMQERLGVPDSKVMVNIDSYGNTTAATIPLGLRDAIAQGRVKKGDLVLILTVGAGYTTGGILMRWAY